MKTSTFNKFLPLGIAIFICVSCKPQQKPGILFKTDPAMYDDGFVYLVFPFNDAFIKANKIKTIAYAIGKSSNKHTNEFDKNGHLIRTYWTQTKEQSQKADTVSYEERIYSPVTGLLDTLIEFDEGNTPFIPNRRVSCYHYDKKNRIEKILKFRLHEINPENKKNADDVDLVGAPVESFTKPEEINTLCVNGRPVDPNTFNIMIRNNDFSSLCYKYYMKDQFSVEEQSELYDFLKKSVDADTCKSKTSFYSYNQQVSMKFFQFDCKGRDDIPSRYSVYKNGLLDSIVEAGRLRPTKDVKFMHDIKNNLTALTNIWNGERVSTLEMIYNEKGLLKELRRISIWDKSSYFMDNTLFFETAFF